jgi:hypothetical protein
MTSMKRAAPILKALLSLWIVYNIVVIVVMPNAGSYFGRITSRFIGPYANSVGLNAGWNFFSPDPAHTMYIRYMVYFNNSTISDSMGDSTAETEKDPIEGYFPAEKNTMISSMFRSRELYVMRFMIINRSHLKNLFGPWLCRQYPGATSVDMEHVIETVAMLDEAAAFRNESMSQLSKEMQFEAERYRCNNNEDEVEL